VANHETEIGTLDLRTVPVKGAEEADGSIDVGVAVRDVPPDELTRPGVLGVVGHAATRNLGLRNEDLENILMVDCRIGVSCVLVRGLNLPSVTTGGSGRGVRIAANPGTGDEVVTGRKFDVEELEPTIDTVEAGSGKERIALLVAVALVGKTEVLTDVLVIHEKITEGPAFANNSVDGGGLIDPHKGIDGTAVVAEALVDVLQNTPGQTAGRSREGEAGRTFRKARSSDDLSAGSGDVLILVGVGPDVLRVLGENADDVLDLILNLPSELKVIQVDVGRVQSGLLERSSTEGHTEGIDVRSSGVRTTTSSATCDGALIVQGGSSVSVLAAGSGSAKYAVAAGRLPSGESNRVSGESTLVDGVGDCRTLTIDPRLLGEVLQIEVAGDDVLRDVIANKTGPLNEQLFDIGLSCHVGKNMGLLLGCSPSPHWRVGNLVVFLFPRAVERCPF